MQVAVAVVTPLETSYPLSQVYRTVPWYIVPGLGVPGDPSVMVGGEPQSTTEWVHENNAIIIQSGINFIR